MQKISHAMQKCVFPKQDYENTRKQSLQQFFGPLTRTYICRFISSLSETFSFYILENVVYFKVVAKHLGVLVFTWG